MGLSELINELAKLLQCSVDDRTNINILEIYHLGFRGY